MHTEQQGLSGPNIPSPGEPLTKTEPGIEIDGDTYPIPTLNDITLDEERILYVYADTVLSDFVPAHPEATQEEKDAVLIGQVRRVRDPAFKTALVHIAYRRKHPDLEDAEIRKMIGKAGALDVDLAILAKVEDRPPAENSQTPPENETNTSPLSPRSDSGSPTRTGSDPADGSPEATGTTGSDTSFRPSLAAVSEN